MLNILRIFNMWLRDKTSPPASFIMENSQIKTLSLPNYVDFIEDMAELNGSTPEKVNYDYCFWHGVVSKERYEEAVWALGIRKAVESY